MKTDYWITILQVCRTMLVCLEFPQPSSTAPPSLCLLLQPNNLLWAWPTPPTSTTNSISPVMDSMHMAQVRPGRDKKAPSVTPWIDLFRQLTQCIFSLAMVKDTLNLVFKFSTHTDSSLCIYWTTTAQVHFKLLLLNNLSLYHNLPQ